jgi:hypothetical protein
MSMEQLAEGRVRKPARGHKKGVKLSKEHKDAETATQLMKFLKSVALRRRNKVVDASRIAAAKAALPFLIPTLQSVEQTVNDTRAGLDASQLLAQIKAMLSTNQALAEEIREHLNQLEAAQQQPQIPLVPDDSVVSH